MGYGCEKCGKTVDGIISTDKWQYGLCGNCFKEEYGHPLLETNLSPEQVEGIQEAIAMTEEVQGRVVAAIEFLIKGGLTDGQDHKQWAIDQALRQLFGTGYFEEVAKLSFEGYTWDLGTPP